MRNSDEDDYFCNAAFLFVCEQLKKDEPRLIPVLRIISELKQRRRRRQRERQKSNRFMLAKQFHLFSGGRQKLPFSFPEL